MNLFTTRLREYIKNVIYVGCFFFQAEDGIRDRSPSRGLGDVYKRQSLNLVVNKFISKLYSYRVLF